MRWPSLSFACRVAAAIAVLLPAGPAAAADPSRSVVEQVASRLAEGYVFRDRGAAAAAMLRTNAANGAYDGIRDAALARDLTNDLAGVLHDKHVKVFWSPEVLPPGGAAGGMSPAEAVAAAAADRVAAYGISRVANLAGGVGYLDLRGFMGAPETAAAIDAAATMLAPAGAWIIDLRANGGGEPVTVARLISHLVAAGTRAHLNDFVDANGAVQDSTFTFDVPGPRFLGPLWVLTSSHTGSAAEEFAYDVRALKRATLVGETTAGAANPGDFRRIDDHFSVFVPGGRARNPLTNTNWEGVGIAPDVATAPEKALAAAYAAALTERLKDGSVTGRRRTALEALAARAPAMTEAEILAGVASRLTP